MSGVFVHGLWGEAEGSQFPTRGHGRTLSEVQRFLDAPWAGNLPTVTFAWGAENYDALASLGFSPILASRVPIVNYSTDGRPREAREGNQVNWGTSHWRQKLVCMKLAMESGHNAIVWLDWDARPEKELPPGFWGRLAEGASFQASLRRYTRPQCGWRSDRTGKRRVPHGAWVYCRDIGLIDQAIEMHERHVSGCTDEVAWAKTLDTIHGGWTGEDGYKRLGHVPFCYSQGMLPMKRSRMVHPCEDPIFINTGKY